MIRRLTQLLFFVAYVVAYNILGQTRKLDSEIRKYILNNIFSEMNDVK